ncbi:MAG: hypothetical protein V7L14_31800 [Nostoc sp.]|uniref:hypothetical protein n=1 Tax=Nostoc sp. TaxID=1180 RepID=UPI002FF83917
MKTRSGGDPDISLASKNRVFGDRQQIDQAISFANRYLSLRASIAIAFLLKAQSVR